MRLKRVMALVLGVSIAGSGCRWGFVIGQSGPFSLSIEPSVANNGTRLQLFVSFDETPSSITVDWTALDTRASPATFTDLAAGGTLVATHTLSSDNERPDGRLSLPVVLTFEDVDIHTEVFLLLDNTPPTLITREPGCQVVVGQGNVELDGTVRDANGVANLEAPGGACTVEGDAWSCVFAAPSSPGLSSFEVQAADLAGNRTSLAVPVFRHTPVAPAFAFPQAVHLTGISDGKTLSVGWGDFGGPEGIGTPDGVYDLVSAALANQPSEVYFRIGDGFDDDDYLPSGIFGDAGKPRHSVSLGFFLPDGLVGSFAMAGLTESSWSVQIADLVMMWDAATSSYVDLASDETVPDDNDILAGSAGPIDDPRQGTYDFSMALFDYDNDGDLDLYRLHGGDLPYIETDPSRVLTNVGTVGGLWRFERRGSPDTVAAHPYAEARGLAVADIDFDGRMDVMVASRNSRMYLNRTSAADVPGFIEFDETSQGLDFRVPDGELMHGVAFFDFDNDGDHDLAWIPYNEEPWALYRTEIGEDGSLRFSPVDLGPAAGRSGVGRKSALYPGDYDNDGDLDLYLTSDSMEPGYPNLLLRNELISLSQDATAPFTDVTPAALAMSDDVASAKSYGGAWVDLDEDGDLDLVTTSTDTINGGMSVIKNEHREQGSRFFCYCIRVRQGGNARPLGTKVVVEFGPHRQLQEIVPLSGFGCSPYPDLHFGVGPYDSVDVHIYAPGVGLADGPTRTLANRPASSGPCRLDIVDID